jgi:hypothetical protein
MCLEPSPKGDMDLTHADWGRILASIVSLVGGFALGPEAPTGHSGGGRRRLDLEESGGCPKRSCAPTCLAALAGAFAGLFTAPFAVILMGLEMKHRQSPYYYGTLMIIAVASVLGFIVFYTAGGSEFSSVLRLLELPTYKLVQWHLPVAVLLGLVAVVFAFLFAFSMKVFHQLMAPLHDQPILRCTGVGLLVGLMGMAMPITLFLGTEGLLEVVDLPGRVAPRALWSCQRDAQTSRGDGSAGRRVHWRPDLSTAVCRRHCGGCTLADFSGPAPDDGRGLHDGRCPLCPAAVPRHPGGGGAADYRHPCDECNSGADRRP